MSLYASELLKQIEKTNQLVDRMIPSQLVSRIVSNAAQFESVNNQSGVASIQNKVGELNRFQQSLLPHSFYQSSIYKNQLTVLQSPNLSAQISELISGSKRLNEQFLSGSPINRIDMSPYSGVAAQMASLDFNTMFDYSHRFQESLRNYEIEDYKTLDDDVIQEVEDEILNVPQDKIGDYLEQVLSNQEVIIGNQKDQKEFSKKESKKGFRLAILSLIFSTVISMYGNSLSIDKIKIPIEEEKSRSTELTQTFIVRSNVLNIRSQPDPESEIVGKLFQGDFVTLLEGNDEQSWFNVSCLTGTGKITGWVNARYLRPNNGDD